MIDERAILERIDRVEQSLREQLDRYHGSVTAEIRKLWSNGLRELGERVARVEASAAAAHHRLDEQHEGQRALDSRLRSITWRVAIIAGAATAGGQLLLYILTN